MPRRAFSFVREFEPAPAERLLVDRHYLLYAVRGALRLEVDGTAWSLPPARAALIRAGVPIDVTIPQPVTTSSVLFSPDFVGPPPASLTVFDMTALARSLVAECAQWGDEDTPLDDYAITMFRALAEATWLLAGQPSPARMPCGRSSEVRSSLQLTADRIGDDPRFEDIAAEVGLAPRSLARRFQTELGMTWRASLRRLRVLRGIELLASTERSVTQIAMDVGYGSVSAFNAAFRDLIGQTPTEYRLGFRP